MEKKKNWDNIDNIVISKSKKKNRKFLIGYLDEVIKLLVLILPKMSGYTKTCLCIDDNKLLGKYKTIWSKIEDLKNIK